jgi:hypothetical protein
MTGIQGLDATADVKALLAAKERVALDRQIQIALDDESVLRGLVDGLLSKNNDHRYCSYQVLLPISQEEPSRLQGEWKGTPPTMALMLAERACLDAPAQRPVPVGAVRAIGDRGLTADRSCAPHRGWG